MKWYRKRIGRFENLSDLVWSFFIEFTPFILISLALILCVFDRAEAVEFNCSNKANWETLSAKTYDFYNSKIRPDGSPNHTLKFDEQLDAFYSKDYNMVAYGADKCVASATCLDSTGYDFSKPFLKGHPAWKNSRDCSCAVNLQSLCNGVKWYRKGYPTMVSGVVGTKFPAYPAPTYPTEWNEQALYTHSFAEGTADHNMTLNISANVDTKYLKSGKSTSIENCGEESTSISGVEVTKKYYLLKGLSNHDQTFNATQPYMEWNEDWGICGKIKQYWNESPATYVSWPSIGKAVPVVALVGNLVDPGFDYMSNVGCASGYTKVDNKCEFYGDHISGTKTCPSYVPIQNPSGGCKKVVDESSQPCNVGWEVNPVNSLQCRKAKAKPPPVAPPTIPVDTPIDDSTAPSWCEGDNDSWDGETQTCTKGSAGGGDDNPGEDAGGGSVDEDSGDGLPTAENFFKYAPVADTNKIGSKGVSTAGFYTPTYGAGVTLSTLFVSKLDSFEANDVSGNFKGLIPPTYTGVKGLPKMCLSLTFIKTGMTKPCIDFADYKLVFDFLKIFCLFMAVMTSWRIILGGN